MKACGLDSVNKVLQECLSAVGLILDSMSIKVEVTQDDNCLGGLSGQLDLTDYDLELFPLHGKTALAPQWDMVQGRGVYGCHR
jgi:hypothetical protein